MTTYHIHPVSGLGASEVLRYLNSFDPEHFPPLQQRHLEHGHWWFARGEHRCIVGFAGLVPMSPFDGVGYLKRAYVVPSHRGHGLQVRFMQAREEKARELGWHKLVSECSPNNVYSAQNFLRFGFVQVEPEQPWGEAGSVYFEKRL